LSAGNVRGRTRSLAMTATVAAATVAGSAGCAATSYDGGVAPSPTVRPSTSAAGTTPPLERTAPGAGHFAGTWFVHGSSMVIKPDGKASMVSNVGPCRRPVRGRPAMCSERLSYRFALSPDGASLTGRLTAIGFETWEGHKVPKSVVGYSTSARVGDTLTLHVAGPGLLSTRWPLTHPLKNMLLEGPGNPFWCAAGTSNAEGLCGA
jgi:hypothetical protein